MKPLGSRKSKGEGESQGEGAGKFRAPIFRSQVEEKESSSKKKRKGAEEALAENDVEPKSSGKGKKPKKQEEMVEAAETDERPSKKPRKPRAKASCQVDWVESRVERILSFLHTIDYENLELDYGLKDQIKERIAEELYQTEIYLTVYWKRAACGVQRKIKGKPNLDPVNFSLPAKMKGTPSLKLAISVGAAVVYVACLYRSTLLIVPVRIDYDSL